MSCTIVTSDIVEVTEINSTIIKFWRLYNYVQLHKEEIQSYIELRSDNVDMIGDGNLFHLVKDYLEKEGVHLLIHYDTHKVCQENFGDCTHCMFKRLTGLHTCIGIGYADIVTAKSVDEFVQAIEKAIDICQGLIADSCTVVEPCLLYDEDCEYINKQLEWYKQCPSYEYVIDSIYRLNSGWMVTPAEAAEFSTNVRQMWYEKVGTWAMDKDWFKRLVNISKGIFDE